MNLALLVLVVGLGFAAHGARTLFGAFGGAGTGGFFEQVGLRPGRLHALLGTPLAAAALIAVMTAAVLTVHGRNEFFVTSNGFEYNLTLAAAVFALAGVGAGHWSLDHALGLDLMSTDRALAALAVGVLGGLGAVLSGRLAGGRGADRARYERSCPPPCVKCADTSSGRLAKGAPIRQPVAGRSTQWSLDEPR